METTTRDGAPADATVTSPMTSSSAEEESCRLYDFVVCTVLIGAFCVFGLVGNATSFVVFCRQHKTDTAASAVLLLQCMAVCDSLLLLVAIAVYALPAVYPYTGHLQVLIVHFMKFFWRENFTEIFTLKFFFRKILLCEIFLNCRVL